MRGRRPIPRTKVLLSFSVAYKELAVRLGGELRVANIEVLYDQWEGGGGLPAIQSVATEVDDVACLLPLLTPAGVTTAPWIGDEWTQAVYNNAAARGVHLLPVRGAGDLTALPDFVRQLPEILKGQSFADLAGQDYAGELQRLVKTIRSRSGDRTIKVPRSSNPKQQSGAKFGPDAAIVIELGGQLAPLLDGEEDSGNPIAEQLPMMYDGLFYELGIQFPELSSRVAADLPERSARIILNGVPEREFEIPPASIMVSASVDELAELGIPAQSGKNPATGHECAWISELEGGIAESHELVIWNAAAYLILVLSSVLRNKAADFLGIDDVSAMLKAIEPVYPKLVAETIPATTSLFVLTDVMRRLVAELVSIRNLRAVLMAVADWGRVENDPALLTEYVRIALKREIMQRMTRGQGELTVLLLDPEIEQQIVSAIRHTATASYLDLEPKRLRAIVDAIAGPMAAFPNGFMMPCILTNRECRSTVRRLVASLFPNLHVLAYHEIRPGISIQPVGRISIGKFRCYFPPWAERFAARASINGVVD